MLHLTATALAAAALSGSALATVVDPLNCPEKDITTCKNTKGCKWSKPLEFCYNKSLGEPEDQTPAPETPEPTAEPTEAPTESPTEAPTESPTEEPTESPVEPPAPQGPFTQENCDVLDSKGPCNRTPTCVYQNQAEKCVGCPQMDSRNSCDRVVGCVWRQKMCEADSSEPHPEDDSCAEHQTKRHCRNQGCQWMRNGKCKGHRGCPELRNGIDCRGAHECFWMPNKNECVDISTDNQ